MNVQRAKAWVFEQDSRDLRTMLCLLLLTVTAMVYCQVATHDFLNYDDHLFVFDNHHVYTGLTWTNFKWAFTTLNGDASYWHPLTWLSLQLDCQIFGSRPGGFHLTNLCLHLANTFLLFLLLNKLTGTLWRSFVVAALFALHPLHIETVAWISERKTLLCTFFWFLTTIAYIRYCHRPNCVSYVVVLLSFFASLMAKPYSVSLPFTLLLLDFWPLRRLTLPENKVGVAFNAATSATLWKKLRRLSFLVLEKIPLFILAGVASWITILAQKDLNALPSVKDLPFLIRFENAAVAYCLYLRKMLWPFDLAPIYPLRRNWMWWQFGSCFVVLLCISVLAVRYALKRPYLLFGWFWYLGTLVPVIGLVQAGSQGLADRYTYVSLIGVFVGVVWLMTEIHESIPVVRPAVCIGTLASILVLSASTVIQVRYWKNSIRLFEHAVNATNSNYIAYFCLGQAFLGRGNAVEGEINLEKSLRINSRCGPAHLCLGAAMIKNRETRDAKKQYDLALLYTPEDPELHALLACFYEDTEPSKVESAARAVEEAQRACELTHYRQRKFVVLLAEAYSKNEQYREAVETSQTVMALSVSPFEIKESAALSQRIVDMQSAKHKM